MLTSHIGTLVQALAALFPFPLPANEPAEVAEGGPRTWATADLDGVPGCWLWSGPALAIEAMWRVKQSMEVEGLSVSLSFSPAPHFSPTSSVSLLDSITLPFLFSQRSATFYNPTYKSRSN